MRKRLSIAERQEKLNRKMKMVKCVLPLIVSAITATLISIMALR